MRVLMLVAIFLSAVTVTTLAEQLLLLGVGRGADSAPSNDTLLLEDESGCVQLEDESGCLILE